MSTDQQTLKLEIKLWEHQFREREGRNPTKEDIKKESDIASKYKQYNSTKLKLSKPKPVKEEKQRPEPLTPSKKHNKQFVTPRKNKSKHREPEAHLETPQKTSPIPPSPVVLELGPTPQLNGRVLSIFDVITTPLKSTPVKEGTTDDFGTSGKKKLDFSGMVDSDYDDDDDDDDDQSISSSPAPLLGERVEVFSSQLGSQFKTPQKTRVITYSMETPAYLKTATLQTATASPSPLASQRVKKGLSTLFEELRDIQDELKYGDYDEDDLIPEGPLDSSSDEEAEKDEIELTEDKGQAKWKKKKRKGPKRQHRLVRIRALASTEKLEVIDDKKDIKEQITKLVPASEENALVSDDSEEWSDDANEYVREHVDFSKMKGKRKPAGISKNFKAYKIQKSKFFGKRARGW